MARFDWDSKKRQIVLQSENFMNVREYFSVKNEYAVHARRRGFFVPDRKYIIGTSGMFDLGLHSLVKSYINNTFSEEVVYSEELLSELAKYQTYKDSVICPPPNITLRDYQEECIRSCLDNGGGIVTIATAGGKTVIFASLLNTIHNKNPNFKSLIIVPDLGLVNQTYKEFQNLGVNFTYSIWTGKNEPDISCNVIIANISILYSKNSDIDFLKYIDVMIQDECHVSKKENKINKIIKSIQTIHKFGFTGTLPVNNFDIWNVFGKIGPVIYDKRSVELRDDKFIAEIKALIIEISYQDRIKYVYDEKDPASMYRTEIDFIVDNPFRNRLIGKLCNSLNNNTLILVDFIRHGETLEKTLNELCPNKKIYFIQGSVDVDVRDQVKVIMEKETNIICIAISKIFSTGINITNIHYIMFCGGGKAKIKILQSIGRGLRLHESKKRLMLIDLQDNLRYGTAHGNSRTKIYEDEKIPYDIREIKE